MLRQARTKTPEAMWACADAMRLPFADQIFGGALCTLAIHHFADLGAAFAEVARVQAEGRFVVFTAWPEQTRGYWLSHYFPRAMARSIDVLPARSTVLRALDAAGFEVVDEEPWWVPPEPVDLFLYAGKHRPELYLDPLVRAGISTFTGLAEPAELETGLARLEADIASGQIDRVIAAHPDQAGDYVLVAARLRDGR
jgi:SAM-dependent methyltransferase